MDNNDSKPKFKDKLHPGFNSRGIETRKQPRREQPDRREIERFGYDKITRRANNDRRDKSDRL